MIRLTVRQIDAVYDEIICENEGVLRELYEYFSYPIQIWIRDSITGKRKPKTVDTHLFKKRGSKLYVGLRDRLRLFAAERNLELRFENNHNFENKLSVEEALEFVKDLKLPHKVRDYQFQGFMKAIKYERRIFLSATNSGKSLLLYLIISLFGARKTLILVPNLGLITQMFNDFKSYGFDSEKYIHCIFSGQEKESNKPIHLSTWQSIYDLPGSYFEDIDAVICDEVHGAKADSIKGIMEKCINAHIRIGCTGTLDDLPLHQLVLEGLFGPIEQLVSTSELVENNWASKPLVKTFILGYSNEQRKLLRKADYQTEVDFITGNVKRNNFIQNLTLEKCKGNTLLLFRLLFHGELLYNILKSKTNRPVYLINGAVEKDEREQIRQILSEEDNAILVASYGTCSTGINIPSIRHIIFASPYKSKIKVLQSIGRGLRLDDGKDECHIWDIADDLTYKARMNHTLKHMMFRIQLYAKEGFDYKIYNLPLEG